MITPSPTSKIEPHLARGVLEAVVPETATKPGYIVLSVPDTSYRIHLRPVGEIKAKVGKRIVGTIRVKARRMDVVETGGRYIEPVFGRPRRVQGMVVGKDEAANAIVVNAGVPVVCELAAPGQEAGAFEVGEVVSGDVMEGGEFAEVV